MYIRVILEQVFLYSDIVDHDSACSIYNFLFITPKSPTLLWLNYKFSIH